jgi:SNF2 family DNA or RNA helicase
MSKPFTPRDYQRIACDFIYENQRCNLWAEPGLGKTSTVYMMLDILKLCGSNFFPALVIAPLTPATIAWPGEQAKWEFLHDMRVRTILGTPAQREAALLERADVYVINYENIPWLVKHFGSRWPFKIVIADEATRLKNFRMKGQGGVRSGALSQVALQTGRWINLTGTPAPNTLTDLWGQMWFVDYGQRLGRTYTDYLRRWFYENQFARTVELRHPSCEAEIHAAVGDVSLALRTRDWFDTHEPLVVPREVEMPPAARALYDRMERDFFIEIGDSEVTAANAAVLSMKLLQMASGTIYDGEQKACPVHDAKIEGLKSLVEDLNGEPLIVTYWFKFEPELLKKAIPGFTLFKGKKEQEAWNAGKIPVLGIHPASAGHGIDLQYGGCKMAHLTHSWDLELLLQVRERNGPARQVQAGFDRVVTYFNMVCRNTMDNEVIERQQTKRNIMDSLMLARARRAATGAEGLI